jgi:hypothetical protein
MTAGARFEIVIDCKPRSYRNCKAAVRSGDMAADHRVAFPTLPAGMGAQGKQPARGPAAGRNGARARPSIALAASPSPSRQHVHTRTPTTRLEEGPLAANPAKKTRQRPALSHRRGIHDLPIAAASTPSPRSHQRVHSHVSEDHLGGARASSPLRASAPASRQRSCRPNRRPQDCPAQSASRNGLRPRARRFAPPGAHTKPHFLDSLRDRLGHRVII